MDKRRECPHCKQELARTAYARHRSDTTGKICPGKRPVGSKGNSPRERSPSDNSLNSSFDFGDEYIGDDYITHSLEGNSSGTGDASDFFESDHNDTEVSSGGEVWDDSESSEEENVEVSHNNSASEIVFGISFFLTYFQLLYRVSESAMRTLLMFIRHLINFLAIITGLDFLFGIVNGLAKSMPTIRKKFKENNFVEYVVCVKCNKLYTFQDCILNTRGQEESQHCDFVEFPSHPLSSKREACGEPLLKKIKVGSKFKLVPRKTYIYHSIIDSLKYLAKKRGFLEQCDLWRSRSKDFSCNMMGDIYDGKLWNEWMVMNGRSFLDTPNNLCLSLNIDWFRVYDHSQYSAGPIYLVILNLPRSERYKEENMILAGIIPGPKEPKQNVNTFLAPLVKDMQILYEGVTFSNSCSSSGSTTLRSVIGCVACDLPATRKVCGFSNFNGNFGCSKCMKEFSTSSFGNKPSYGGFDCDNWCPRDLSTHTTLANRYSQANTVVGQKKIIREGGVKYSELMNLPNFNVIRCHVIDPMHNIFLGLSKHVIQTWKELGILQMSHFAKLQEKVDLINPPPKVGRIPRKIESGFAAFTADEWKNFILIYSAFALKDVVAGHHYNCWCLLVSACALLCRPILPRDYIEQAHILLIEFCKLFESLYGEEHCTPNMHMSLHLKECLLDFGPFPAFWCFAFERYNGILEGISKSWTSPEKQMFLKFTELQRLQILTNSMGENKEFMAIICDQFNNTKAKCDFGSLRHNFFDDSIGILEISNCSCSVEQIKSQKMPYQKLVIPYKEKYFNNVELSHLTEMYKLLYPSETVEVSRFYKEHKSAIINSVEYISKLSRSQRSPVIAARWSGVSGIDHLGVNPIRIGLVTSFIENKINILPSDSSPADLSLSHVIARVQWYGDHPRRDFIDSSIILTTTIVDNDSCASFMPVSRIVCQCAISLPVSLQFDYGLDTVLVAVPLCVEL